MAVAKARDFQKLKMTDAAKQAGTSLSRVGQASIVLQYAPDMADVLAGGVALDAAYGGPPQ